MSPTDETITLRTSDDPPVLIKVSRAALVANSQVFADMFASNLQSHSNDISIPLSEGGEEIKVFVSMLQSQQTEQDFNKLTQKEWEIIAKLADKYDSWVIRSVVEAKVWKITVEGNAPAFAFNLATLIGSPDLIKCTAKRAVLIRDLNAPELHVAQHWKDVLATWRALQTEKCFATLQRWSSNPRCPESCGMRKARAALVAHVLRTFDICCTPPVQIPQKFLTPQGSLCTLCEFRGNVEVSWLQDELSQWVEFPVGGMDSDSMRAILKYKAQ